MRKKVLVFLAVLLVVGIAATALAASDSKQTAPAITVEAEKGAPARVMDKRGGCGITVRMIAELAGVPEEEVMAKVKEGKSCAEIAKEYGIFEKFKQNILERKKEDIDRMVEKGKITKERAEELKKKVEEKISAWDGSRRINMGMWYPQISANALKICASVIDEKVKEGIITQEQADSIKEAIKGKLAKIKKGIPRPDIAGIIAELAGVDREKVIEKRKEGKSYKEIAEEYGVSDELKQRIRELKKNGM